MDIQQIDPRLPAIKDCLYRLAAKALIARDKKLLLTHEGHHGRMAALKFRGLPGGGVDYGEDFRTGLQRELFEELDLELELEQISEKPLKSTFGMLADGIFSGGKNIPTLSVYFSVSLAENQVPVEGENNFEWVDLGGLKSANLVSQTAPDRDFLIDYLKESD